MVLIADSGATKTDWCVVGRGGVVVRFRTPGINVSVMSGEEIHEVVEMAAVRIGKSIEEIVEVHFYGAGIVGGEFAGILTGTLESAFPEAAVEVDTDLMAAAKALWGDHPGVVAILGTGSNSCRYDGSRIVENVRPGGFILGDEGGGAALGKMLLADFVKGLLPEDIMAKLRLEKALDYTAIVKNVYRSANPAAYLASFAPFVFENIDNPYLAGMVEGNFRRFVRRSLSVYRATANAARISGHGVVGGIPENRAGGGAVISCACAGEGIMECAEPLKVGIVGSLGCAGKDILFKVAQEHHVEIERMLQSPMDGLIEYYKGKAVPGSAI